jgi:hypothetical protein
LSLFINLLRCFIYYNSLKRGIKSGLRITELNININLLIINLEIKEYSYIKNLLIKVLNCRIFSRFNFITIFINQFKYSLMRIKQGDDMNQ